MCAERLAHGRRRGHCALHLPLRISGHLVGGAVIGGINHGQSQVAGAVDVRWNHPQLGRHMRRHRRQDVARHPRQGRRRDARNHQILLKCGDQVLLIEQPQSQDGLADRSAIALLERLGSLQALLGEYPGTKKDVGSFLWHSMSLSTLGNLCQGATGPVSRTGPRRKGQATPGLGRDFRQCPEFADFRDRRIADPAQLQSALQWAPGLANPRRGPKWLAGGNAPPVE